VVFRSKSPNFHSILAKLLSTQLILMIITSLRLMIGPININLSLKNNRKILLQNKV
jgi:hypothetical protein